jgi:hypothetical protein
MAARALELRPDKPMARLSWGVRTLIALELAVGVSAVLGGLALVVRPDGSLLQAKRSVLAGTPFSDWRVPGLLLATLVGGGSLLAAGALWRRVGSARVLALLVATGVVAFELVEWLTIGFQPLEAIVAALEAAMFVLAWRVGSLPHPVQETGGRAK